jgi:hypothetical protein
MLLYKKLLLITFSTTLVSPAIATCKTLNRRTQQVIEAAVMQKRNCSVEGNCGRQQGGFSSRNTQHLIDHSPLLFAAPVTSIGNHRKTKQKKRIRHRSNLKPVNAG